MVRRVPVLVLIGLFAVPSVLAKDPPKPSELYAEKETEFRRAVAAKYLELGDEAKKQKLFQFAREAYHEALAYDPNYPAARKVLGFVRKGSEWVIDPSEARKLPEQNSKVETMPQSEFDKILEAFKDSKKKVELFVGRKYAGLGKWCEKEGLADQAKKAYEKAIILDPDNEVARTGLGYQKVDGEWLTEKQLLARQEAKEGKLVDDTPSRYEGPLGIQLHKMESAHFRIEAVLPPDQLKECVKKVETAYAYFLRDVGEPEIKDVWPSRCFLMVLGDVAQWHKYVDLFSGGSQKDRDFTKQCKGTQNAPGLHGVQYQGEDSDISTTIDGLVHKVTHFLVHHYWNLTSQAWLQEGFAYYYTVKVLESTRTRCVALGSYDRPTGGMKDWGESQNWKELIKKDVLASADPDLRMFYGQNTAELQYNASVKAWSMISWLFDKHRENFLKWLTAVGREGQGQEEAFKAVFNWSFEEVDKNWRDFVKENY
ncbi:MAG: hypothetical protein MUE73_12315 [Planctomycetes bacterium]|nr:hypothetical protein [Planctomycetota bacterium]